MAQHPYWRGQIRIALITLPVHLYTATRRSSHVTLHEIDRNTGERIHHQNVTDEGRPVEDEDIVKAYEYQKGEYVILEKDELQSVKLPSGDTLELEEFVDLSAIPLAYFERPYFLLPEGKGSTEIYDVIRSALEATGKAGIGQVALYGREQLCAVSAFKNGMMLQTLRYADELQELPEIYSAPATKVKGDYLALAEQLIEKGSKPFDLSRFQDHYREALRELIEAKQEHRKPVFAARPKPEKVVNFMDALRRSLEQKEGKRSPPKRQPAMAEKRSKRKSV
jgi:DNA end-binding protein Ku